MSYGFAGHIGIAEETTWGTALAATDYFEALSESIVTNIERFDVRNITGGFFEPDDETGVQRHAGDVVIPGHPVSIGYLLNGVLGTNSISTVLSGFLFTNNFTFLTSDINSLHPLVPYTLEVFRDVTSAQQFSGVQFGALQIGVAPNQDLRFSASVLAQTRNNIAATTPSFPGSPTGVFKFDTASIQIGGAANTKLEAVNLTLDNQIEGLPALNASAEIARVKRNGFQMVRLSGTMTFEDQTEKDIFIAETEQAVLLNFTKADSFSLLVDIPRFVYSTYPDQMSGRDRLTVDFEGIGRYHTGSSSAIRISLTTTNTF